MSQKTFEAVIDEHGNARFPDAVRLPQGTKVTVLVEETERVFYIPPRKPGSVVRMPSVRIVRNADAKPLTIEVTDVENDTLETVTQYEDIIAGLPGLAKGDKRVPAFRIEKIKQQVTQ